ncbi:MAG: thioredoxin family protein [Pelagibacterales bacterium]|nr:thioredoxin family protein [Pelagibacterales bacterium]|tara:strand:- start:214 stop:756 length:543 start_codon:yes stop_codon:yes gene_type:complete
MLTESPNIDKNFVAKEFNLKNIDGKFYNLNDIRGKNGTLIFFICNHCPYVKAIVKKLVRDVSELKLLGINSVGIMSNDYESYPEDSYDNMKTFSKINNFSFPYLIDETQEIAKNYKAVCTPDFFGFNDKLNLKYRGRLDSSALKNDEYATRELFYSMKAISEKKEVPYNNPSIGCSIKWK